MNTSVQSWEEIKVLLRGEAVAVALWTREIDRKRLGTWMTTAVLGAGLFGAAMGWWRAPEQALYTAVKFPLVVLLTMLGNGALNGMLAPLLGVNIGFRQSLQAVTVSFVIAATILGSLSPLLAALIWNTPPLERPAEAGGAHAFILLAIVLFVAFAGLVANLRLLQLLEALSGSRSAARRVLVAWLAGNLLLGSQISWILRPFIGSPGLPVQFLRDDPMRGGFFAAVAHSIQRLLFD